MADTLSAPEENMGFGKRNFKNLPAADAEEMHENRNFGEENLKNFLTDIMVGNDDSLFKKFHSGECSLSNKKPTYLSIFKKDYILTVKMVHQFQNINGT